MMQWWRCKHGAPFDTKWRTIARRVNGRPGDVWAVASALFDAASQAEPRGDISKVDLEEIADGFGYEFDYVTRIYEELKNKDVHDGQLVLNFEKHQTYEDTTAAERKRRQREREKAEKEARERHAESQEVTLGHGDVTAERDEVTDGHAENVTVTADHAPSQQVTPPDTDSDLEQIKADQSREGEGARAQDGNSTVVEGSAPKPTAWQVGVEVPAEWKRDAEKMFAELKIPLCDIELEARRFTAYYGSRGELRDNWHVGWINWILKAKPITPARAKIQAALPEGEEEVAARMAARREAWGGHPAVETICTQVGEHVYDQYYAPCRLTFIDGKPKLIAPTKRIRDELALRHWKRLEDAFKAGPVDIDLEKPAPKMVAA